MQALQLLNEGKLDDALQSAIQLVRDKPGQAAAREILVELFCIQGDLVRADKQAEAILVQQPEAAMTATLLRQLIRAETARRECWLDGRVPEFVGEPGDACEATLAALVALRSGNPSDAVQLLEDYENQRPERSGECDGTAFEDFRDADDFCANILEVLTSTGKYFWVPIDKIQRLQFEPVTRARDLIWRQCHLIVDDGPDGVVYMPSRYVHTDLTQDSAERLGRATDWLADEGVPVQGLGQRLFVADERECGMMDITALSFEQSTDSSAE